MKQTQVSYALTSRTSEAVFLQWASETGAQGMPIPRELEQLGWHRLSEHPLFHGTWLMEAAEPRHVLPPPPPRERPRADRAR
jgi:hypothetical protein